MSASPDHQSSTDPTATTSVNSVVNEFRHPLENEPLLRLRETWTFILRGYGWEYELFKKTVLFSSFSGLTYGYLMSVNQQKEAAAAVAKQPVVSSPSRSVPQRQSPKGSQFLVNLRNGSGIGMRFAAIPITLCAITLSTLSYRNAVYPLDFVLLYGTCGGLYMLTKRRGLRSVATGAATTAAVGLLSGGIIWSICRSAQISVAEFRRNMISRYYSPMDVAGRLRWAQNSSQDDYELLMEREKRKRLSRKDVE